MIKKKKKRKNKIQEENHFLLSINDLLMVFILILFLLFAVQYSINLANRKDVEARKTVKKIELIAKLHDILNDRLIKSFEEDDQVQIDVVNQELILDDSILFGINQWKLKGQGKQKLRTVLPTFFSTFVDDESVVKWVESLIIEGHTDDLGSPDQRINYLHNLDLSQKRAYEVVTFIYNDKILRERLDNDRLGKLRVLLTSNGKSHANLIYEDESKQTVDRNKSRRVTIKYKLDIQKMLTTQTEQLERDLRGLE